MELRQLRYFTAIVEEGSLSRAALRLHISQPPLSTQLKALESAVGATLLLRGNRGVRPTPAGTAFYEDARDILQRLDRACERAQQVHRGEVGRVAVGFVSIADYSVLPAALQHFRQRFPQAEVQLHELTTDMQLEDLRANRLDLAIGLAPVDDPEISFRTLHREDLVLATPTTAQHSDSIPCVRNGPVDLRALAQTPFIVPPRKIAPGLHDLIVSRCQTAGFSPRITQHARQMQTVISLVSAGMGVALVPSSVRKLQRSGVRYHSLSGRTAQIELGILQRRDSTNALRDNFVESLFTVESTGATE